MVQTTVFYQTTQGTQLYIICVGASLTPDLGIKRRATTFSLHYWPPVLHFLSNVAAPCATCIHVIVNDHGDILSAVLVPTQSVLHIYKRNQGRLRWPNSNLVVTACWQSKLALQAARDEFSEKSLCCSLSPAGFHLTFININCHTEKTSHIVTGGSRVFPGTHRNSINLFFVNALLSKHQCCN